MIFKITILPSAKSDLDIARKWYSKQQKGLGRTFLNKFKEYQSILETNPHFFKRYKNVHTLPMKQFPFMIYFNIDVKNRSVLILAVLHTSINPRNWL